MNTLQNIFVKFYAFRTMLRADVLDVSGRMHRILRTLYEWDIQIYCSVHCDLARHTLSRVLRSESVLNIVVILLLTDIYDK